MRTRLMLILGAIVMDSACGAEAASAGAGNLAARVGQRADIAPSAYLYRADRKPEENPPEGWILLMQYANQPFNKPLDVTVPAIRKALCGLLWEEVRPVRRVELSWTGSTRQKPSADDVVLTYFDTADQNAHTWWNPRTIKEAGKPEVSTDGRTYIYTIPSDTWGVVVAVHGRQDASAYAVPEIRAFVPDVWKKMDVEVEWGFEAKRAGLEYDGRIEAYDGVLAGVRPLDGDVGTKMTGLTSWRSARKHDGRRGVRFSVLYMGTSPWRRVWPYAAQKEDVARTILTVWTRSGSFSFLAADLENGPVLAPEYGFFVRATARLQAAPSAKEPAVAQVPREVLATKIGAIPGVPLVRGWSSNIIPWLGVNATGQEGVVGSLRVPARSVAMHPLPDRDVAVGWRSPMQGRVSVKARVVMGDSAGGNGIDWSVACENKAGRNVLAHGSVGTGGSQSIPADADAKKLDDVAVQNGDMVSLVVGAKGGSHSCDTTIVELVVTEVGGSG